MILKILGSGTSTGVPLPGCRCSVCSSSEPRNKRLRTSAALLFDTGNIALIDASTDLRSQALQHQIDRADAVVFTHAHADHILGIDDLRAFNFAQRMPSPCFATETTLSSIRRTFWYIFDVDPRSHKSSIPSLTTHTIRPYEPLRLFDEEILPFALDHGGMEVLGFKVRNCAYATDCNSIPPASIELLRGVDTLILDALRYEPHPTHFTIEQALEIIQEVKPRQAWLIHLAHTIDYATVSRNLPPGVALAHDGLEIHLSHPATPS